MWLRSASFAVAVGTLCWGALLTGCGGRVNSDREEKAAQGAIPRNVSAGGTTSTVDSDNSGSSEDADGSVDSVDSVDSDGSAGSAGSAGAPASAGAAGVLDSAGGAGSVEVMLTCEPTAAMLSANSGPHPGPCRTEQDEGFDGTIDSIWVKTYDELGRLVSTESVATETNTTYIDTAIYDEQGQLATRSSGPEGGPPTWVNVYTYDDEGRLLQTITAPLGPGEPPLITDYIYDDAGTLLRLEESRQFVGTIEARVLIDYDAAGRRFRDTYQRLVDGEWMTTRIVETEFDAAGNEVATRIVPPRHGDSSGVRGAAWLWPDPGETRQ